MGLLSHLCNLVDDHRYKTYHLGLFQFLDVFPGLLHRLQFQSSLPTFTSADASSLAPNPLPLPLEQCPGWDQRLIPCTMRLLYTLTTSAFNASEAVRMLCPLMDFIINTSSDTGHSAFVYQAVLQTPHVLHHSAEPDAPLPVHTWRTAAIRLLLLLLQQLPAGVHDSVLGHYSWEGLLPMLGVVCPITRELLLQVFAVMLKSAKCYDKFTASEFKGPEILYSHLHRRNKMSLSGFPSAPSMSSEGVASPLPTDPAACGPALGGPYHARHGREASTDDAASAPDAAAAPSQSTSSRASPLMTDSSVSSLDIEWEEDATTLDCFEPSVRELQIIVNLLLPPDRAFSILASPECPDLFARYFAPYLRLPRRHPNADAYLRYLRQCIVAAQGGQEGEDGQDLTNPIPSNTEHRRSSNSPGIATASPRPSHAAAARPPPATPAGGSGLGYASALNIEDFLTPLFSFLGAVVPPAPSKGDPCIDTLNTCNIRFKRMLLLTALHDIFVHGSQSVKDVFIRKECHFLLMRSASRVPPSCICTRGTCGAPVYASCKLLYVPLCMFVSTSFVQFSAPSYAPGCVSLRVPLCMLLCMRLWKSLYLFYVPLCTHGAGVCTLCILLFIPLSMHYYRPGCICLVCPVSLCPVCGFAFVCLCQQASAAAACHSTCFSGLQMGVLKYAAAGLNFDMACVLSVCC